MTESTDGRSVPPRLVSCSRGVGMIRASDLRRPRGENGLCFLCASGVPGTEQAIGVDLRLRSPLPPGSPRRLPVVRSAVERLNRTAIRSPGSGSTISSGDSKWWRQLAKDVPPPPSSSTVEIQQTRGSKWARNLGCRSVMVVSSLQGCRLVHGRPLCESTTSPSAGSPSTA